MAWFEVHAEDLDGLSAEMERYGQGAGQMVDEVLHGEGAQLIKNRITPLIPRSGRTWNKKGRAAAAAMPGAFSQDNGRLSVTVAARGKYHYLYFPDDGSNTRKHAGNKQFMLGGAEAAAEEVIERCLGKLLENY